MKLALILAALVAVAAAEWKTYEGYQQWEVIPTTTKQVETLRHWMVTENDFDFWLEPRRLNAPVHVLIPQNLVLPKTFARFFDLGLNVEVIDENVGATVEQERQRLANKPRAVDLDDFNTYEDIMDWMDDLARDCPSGLSCEVYNAGNSYEGREMKVLHVVNPSANNPAVYWIDAAIHAREWLAPATLLKIMDHLIYNYGSDADATDLLDNREWYFMPIMNPDGYSFTWSDDRMWRKNRQPGGNCIGTDLNRNFDFRWCEEGASTNPCSDSYCGSSGASAPETQNVQKQSDDIASSSNQRAWITIHSYGRMWMFPWGNTVNHNGFQCERADDHEEMARVAAITAKAIEDTHNTNWADGTSCEVIYETTGGTDDYVKGIDDFQHAICPELRGSGFIVNPSEIQPSFEEIYNGLVAMVGEV